MIERLISGMIDAIEEIVAELGAEPSDLIMATTALSVRLCWASLEDKSKVRDVMAVLVDDFATQSQHGPMVTQ